jgi:hypothetical protein
VKKIAWFTVSLLLSVLLVQSAWKLYKPSAEEPPLDKINLALRRTAHLLLQESGDSTSRIPPVERLHDNVWVVRMERRIDYDKLPKTLQESLALHGYSGDYDVALLRCADDELLLGYSFQDFAADNQNIPCQGREMLSECYNLQLTLTATAPRAEQFPLVGWLISGLLATALFALWRSRPGRSNQNPARSQSPAEWLTFGQTRLDVANQTLWCGEARHSVTYREAKLLSLFAQRPNQVLERNFIIENVWADEGVLVGRSVDMFVSRLRKLLRDDPSIKLVAVHGVGYRMEVAP